MGGVFFSTQGKAGVGGLAPPAKDLVCLVARVVCVPL
jgi:hypothetical protein